MSAEPFMICERCQVKWQTRNDFMADEEVVCIGYQANYKSLEKGLFLFSHSCQNSLFVAVCVFSDLYAGPVFGECLVGTEKCSGYCLHRNILKPCPRECECAYVREVLQLLDGPALYSS